MGQRPKTGIGCPFGAKNRYILKSSIKRTPHEPCYWSKTHCACFCRRKPRYQVHPSCLLCVTSVFLSFFSQSAILHSSTLGPLNECRRTERPPPHLTPRHTSNTRTCLLLGGRAKLLHRRIDRAYLDFRCSQRTAVRGHGAYWYPYVVSMCLGGGVWADTCVARMP